MMYIYIYIQITPLGSIVIHNKMSLTIINDYGNIPGIGENTSLIFVGDSISFLIENNKHDLILQLVV